MISKTPMVLSIVFLLSGTYCKSRQISNTSEDQPILYRTTVKALNVRTLPDQKSPVAFVITENQTFRVEHSTFFYAEIDGLIGGWVKIDIDGRSGYVFDGYIRKINPSDEEHRRIFTDGIAMSAANGVIEGCFSYPAHGIPGSMLICAENLKSHQVYCGRKKYHEENQTKYEYSQIFRLAVPAGKYFVYELDPHDPSFRGDFTERVSCGLNVKCESIPRNKIPVEVTANQITDNVLPHDYF